MRQFLLLAPFLCTGCTVVALADAAVTVTAVAVKSAATVVGTAVDITATGVKAVTGEDPEEKK